MLKSTYLLIGIILLLIICGIFYRTNEISSIPPQNQQPTITPVMPINNSQIEYIWETVKNLIAEKKNQKCALITTIQNITITGTIYTENGKMRTDFTSKSLPINITGHLTMDTQYAYFWTDASSQGVKILIPETQTTTTITPKQPSPETTAKPPFSCIPWNPDPAFFTLPSDIIFQTIPAEPTSQLLH